MSTSKKLALSLALATFPIAAFAAAGSTSGVMVTVKDAEHKVDITIDGKPFTSYLWQTNQRKPILYPLTAPDGTIVTRGYPFVTIKGERVDHPHHAGLWFNYSNLNNVDFWNNSDAVKPELRPRFGSIDHERIVTAKSGPTSGELVTESSWYPASDVPNIGSNQTPPILRQTTRYIFSKLTIGGKSARAIDMTVTLTALATATFYDAKDGMLGIRVAQFLESPTEKGGTTYASAGTPPPTGSLSALAAADTVAPGASLGATGVYRTSEGIVGDDVWSTRGRWCELSGTTPEGKPETIAIIDHTGNPNYPTYWHARGYGLFAANPLGGHMFAPKSTPLNFVIEKGKSATFHYRILLISGTVKPEDLNQQADTFDREQ